ncbi:MAG TPA: glycoside hydrolase family 78 protein [Prolixibacteraceae bacterium]|nr:glycoside hydrolase family 78 protein [Prolixibacteraceae bacterium]
MRLLLISLLFLSLKPGAQPMPVNMKCEHLVNPLGIDAPNPRLSWQLDDARNGAGQSDYQIVAGTDSSAVANGQGAIWDTRRVSSDNMLVTFAGQKLEPFTKYFWKVTAWDQDGKERAESPVASFETGMMDQRNWHGAWITDTRDIALKPAPYFRQEIEVKKKIVSARAYVAVGGLFELYVNGKKVGDHRLDPMYTRFDRRTLYVTHDVTSYLRDGKNALGVLLGNGWYNHQSTAVWYFDKAPWRARPKFCLDLRIVYNDGTVQTISSGTSWKTSLSPVIFNSIYTGEHHDANLEQPGWNTPGFDDSRWTNSKLTAVPSQNVVSQQLQPIRATEEIAVKSFKKYNDTLYVFNLGRNIAGVSRISVKGLPGTKLILKHGERLYPNGMVDQSNIAAHYRPTDDKDPFGTDIYILKGGETETFSPHFNYKGFQYIEISSDKPVELSQNSVTGLFMHSDVPPVGKIKSSNPTLNKIWAAANASYLSNLYGYPTDCPQREKNGWTGDGQIAVETGLFNFDGITVYEKWLADHRDEQQPNGVLPNIIPTSGWGYDWANGPDWTSSLVIIPWNVYQFYGDDRLLKQTYENIKSYVDYIDRISPENLTDWGLGDWIPVKSKASKELTSSCYYYTDAAILAKTAKMFGNNEDFEKYSALAEKIKKAINRKFLNTTTGIYATGLQTELAAPLFWGVVPDELKPLVAANLAKRVEADLFHLDVGLLGTKALLNALSENGYAEVAYKVASQETFPSWGWWIVNGATTLYENWPIDAKSDISLNHIMFGEISAWFYKALGGIRPDPARPGFKNILLDPHFVKGLAHFEASHMGPYGLIVSKWVRTKNKMEYSVTVPANSSAILTLPALKVKEGKEPVERNQFIKIISSDKSSVKLSLSAGNYNFTWSDK